MSDRLFTALDMYLRDMRQEGIANIDAPEVVKEAFKFVYYLGIASTMDFGNQVAQLPEEDGLRELTAMREEVIEFLNNPDETGAV